MKKKIIFVLLTFLGFFLGGVFVKAAENPSIYHIVTTAGVDASREITINYHADDSGSYVLLTEANDTEFEKALKYKPTMEKFWSTEGVFNADTNDTFGTKRRYVCYLELTDLTPRTKYIYKVVLKDEESAVYSFMTAGLTNDWTFIAFSDFQNRYNTVTHPLINSINTTANKSPLVICSGDAVDVGAYEAEWSWLLDDKDKTFSNFIYMSAPGDHEYWGEDKSPVPMMKEPVGYNNIFKHPSNGPAEAKNSCYYFYYNNVLFVSLDFLDSNTVSNAKIDAEATWFKNTIKSLEGTFQYLVVFEHKSIYGSSIEDSSVAKKIRPQWYPLFDEAKVDLVISGHDHEHSRTYQLYNNAKSDDPLVGTYYLDMGSSGNKRRALDNSTVEDGLHQKVIDIRTEGMSMGSIITVTENNMLVTCVNQNGDAVDSFIIKAKRAPLTYDFDFNLEKFKEDIEIVPKNTTAKLAELKLNDSSELKYIKRIEVSSKRTNLLLQVNYNVIKESYELTDVSGDTLKFKLTLLNGEEVEFEKSFDIGKLDNLETYFDGELHLKWDGELTSFEKLTYKLFVDDEEIEEIKKTSKKDIILSSDYLVSDHTIGINVYAKEELIASYSVEYKRLIEEIKLLFKYQDWLDLDVGAKYLVIKASYVKITIEDSSIARYDEATSTLEVLKEGETTYKYQDGDIVFVGKLATKTTEVVEPSTPTDPVDPEPGEVDTPEVIDEPDTPTNPDEPVIEPTPTKKGCASAAIQSIYSILALLALAFIIRRKYA